jgi:hypothetical protein
LRLETSPAVRRVGGHVDKWTRQTFSSHKTQTRSYRSVTSSMSVEASPISIRSTTRAGDASSRRAIQFRVITSTRRTKNARGLRRAHPVTSRTSARPVHHSTPRAR